jgi:putative endonuclease
MLTSGGFPTCREATEICGLRNMSGYMYILLCSDGSYYTGSTNDLNLRILQHQQGEGANHTRKRLPVKLVYYEEYSRVDEAFYREKQIQKWSQKKKEALINGENSKLPEIALAYRYCKFLNGIQLVTAFESISTSSMTTSGTGSVKNCDNAGGFPTCRDRSHRNVRIKGTNCFERKTY